MSCTAMHYLSMRQILKTNPETTAYRPVEASRLECLIKTLGGFLSIYKFQVNFGGTVRRLGFFFSLCRAKQEEEERSRSNNGWCHRGSEQLADHGLIIQQQEESHPSLKYQKAPLLLCQSCQGKPTPFSPSSSVSLLLLGFSFCSLFDCWKRYRRPILAKFQSYRLLLVFSWMHMDLLSLRFKPNSCVMLICRYCIWF